MDFFSKEDFEILASVGGTPYRHNNKQNLADADIIKKGPLAKTDYWAKLLKEKLPGFEFQLHRHWQQSGTFRRYTWVTIYKSENRLKNIYFTIGIDGECGIVYKLDYQKDKTSTLSAAQMNRCEEIKAESNAGWNTIEAERFVKYSWEKLVEESARFILYNEKWYDYMIKEVCCRDARICWNSYFWQKPSGPDGKATSDSYEKRNGFGHEEWLFDFEKIIDGYHYAFIEPINKANIQQGIYDILLWTIDGTKTRQIVANIKNVEIITESQYQYAIDIYSVKGWIAEMQKQIADVNGNVKAFGNVTDIAIFNIRFKPQDVEFINAKIEDIHQIPKQNRYVLTPRNIELNKIISENRNNVYQFESGKKSQLKNAPQVSVYQKEPKMVEMSHIHTKVSECLWTHLSQIYGQHNVAQENSIGSRKIDMVVHCNTGDVFYEIKTYKSLRVSVREAIGQLLEYSFYPNTNNSIRMVIVAQGDNRSAEYKDIEKYIKHLREQTQMSIYLMLCNNEDYTFSKEI